VESFSGTIASADGVIIHYQVHGKGAPALVFVHGWTCNQSHWEQQLESFSQSHTVVTLDLAGHGKSELGRTSWTMSAFADDVVAVAEELQLEPFILVGHSMGGSVILEVARKIPDRLIGLVGVDTYWNVEQSRTPEQVAERMVPFHSNFVETVDNVSRGMFLPTSDPALVERVVAGMSATLPEAGIGAFTHLLGRDNSAVLKELDLPILAINSESYRTTNIEAAERFGIEVVFMSGVGHFVMLEDPETFNRLLKEAIGKLVPPAP
jgi:pimeloyl-ACP methyl ester carboxylesterase